MTKESDRQVMLRALRLVAEGHDVSMDDSGRLFRIENPRFKAGNGENRFLMVLDLAYLEAKDV